MAINWGEGHLDLILQKNRNCVVSCSWSSVLVNRHIHTHPAKKEMLKYSLFDEALFVFHLVLLLWERGRLISTHKL